MKQQTHWLGFKEEPKRRGDIWQSKLFIQRNSPHTEMHPLWCFTCKFEIQSHQMSIHLVPHWKSKIPTLQQVLFGKVSQERTCALQHLKWLLQFSKMILYEEGMRWLDPSTWLNPPKPNLQLGPSVVLCVLSITNSTFIDWSIVGLLILFRNDFFCILLHDYTLLFNGSSCCKVSCYY